MKVKQTREERSREIHLWYAEFEVSMKYPSGDVGHPVMYKNLKFRREYGLEMLIRVC